MLKIYATVLLFGFALTGLAQSPGFFLNDFQPRTAVIPSSFTDTEKTSKVSQVTVNVDFNDVITPVSKYLFGNNANPYMTQMVDQPALLDHIKTLSPNVIRFPGGNLSSIYFWNAAPGHAPSDAPAKLVDANGAQIDAGYWYGQNTQGWTLSVDNYYGMLQQTASTGIITINYGYARYSTADNPIASAAHLAAEWVRHDNGRTKFWEVGNESNGTWQAGHRINTATNKDGQPQIITGELYGKHFKVFADSMRKAANEKGATIYIGAQLLQEAPASWWNNTDRNWNTGVFQHAANSPDYYIIHSYYTAYGTNSNATDVINSAASVTKGMMDYVNSSMASAGVMSKPIALTEWNIFAEGSKQQVSYVNGIHAAIVLGELIKNKYGLSCRWDLANGWGNGNDHGMFSQGDEPGVPKWHPRAPFYYMYYFQQYFGDHMVNASVTGSTSILAYASKFSSGQAGLVVVNKGTTEQTVDVTMQNFGYGDRYYWHSLTGGTDNGEFSLKVFANGTGPTLSSGGPPDLQAVKARSALIGSGVKVTLPARSVQFILIESGSNTITNVEPGKEIDIKVYPNPVEENIKIEFPSTGFTRLEISDGKGAKVFECPVGRQQSSLEIKPLLSGGFYTIRLYKGRDVFYKKIVIR
jgi:hypothetical protein